MFKHRHRLAKEVAKASSLKISKSEQPDVVPDLPALCRADGLDGL